MKRVKVLLVDNLILKLILLTFQLDAPILLRMRGGDCWEWPAFLALPSYQSLSCSVYGSYTTSVVQSQVFNMCLHLVTNGNRVD